MHLKVLITGGDGFIGSHICRLLVKKHVISVLTMKLQVGLLTDIKSEVEIIQGDITNQTRVNEVVRKVKPDVIIHLAAFGIGENGVAKSVEIDPQAAFQVNVTGTYYLYQAAVENNVKQMIISSSTTVYPMKKNTNIEILKESGNEAASNLYGLTKKMIEEMAQYFKLHYSMPTISIRLPLVYGPGRWYRGAGGPLVDMFERAYTEAPAVIKGSKEPIDLMYVKDIAYFIDDIFEQDCLGITDVVNVKSHTTTIPEMIHIINQLTNKENLLFEFEDLMPVYPLIDISHLNSIMSFHSRYKVEEACKDYLNVLKGEI